ncbi:hypothetical protein Gogos_002360 [Gossypium gossypioides]|uniref:Uncharacterized protein n=1 Tax=Gossypium gossypioides TaxID=34282 RepID=A0A7J9CRK3_GOSGO|nr:hypothetical protein [Gossypium gossypioides]
MQSLMWARTPPPPGGRSSTW